MDKTLSVFGSSGFIGRNFVSKYDSHKIPRECNTPIEDTDILYLISTTHNYHVFDNPFLDIETNLTKLVSVLQEFRRHCARRTFNFISSCFVYGDTEYPAKETTVCNPKGFYSITKLAAERLIISYCETFNLNYRILRLCNVYGEHATGVSKKRNALQFMVQQLINGGVLSSPFLNCAEDEGVRSCNNTFLFVFLLSSPDNSADGGIVTPQLLCYFFHSISIFTIRLKRDSLFLGPIQNIPFFK